MLVQISVTLVTKVQSLYLTLLAMRSIVSLLD